ncbi:MAG: pyridoxamine 5'-phosphate oxidase family protein [Lapillicoccus sp.]
MTADTRTESLDTVRSIMKDVRTCMFVTTADDGSLHAAPMTTQEAEFDGDAWFIASSRSETVRNLTSRPRVNASYAGTTAWLSLTGSAAVVDDTEKKKELWNTVTEAWFPEGQDDPSVVVVTVSGESAQYWDSPGRVAMTLDMVKARVTGNPPKSGDAGTVDLEG